MARTTRSSTTQKKRKRSSSQESLRKIKHQRTEHQSLIPTHNASQILDILEMTDTQGLLDRVFATADQPSLSLRALLRQSADHPLPVLRSAVQNLLPLSAHPRSRPSPTAAQQLRFCNLALSLLDHASQATASIPLDTPSIFASPQLQSRSSPPPVTPRYALMQHLPTGEYWTSIDSTLPPASFSPDVKDLPTAYAELVAILPSSSLTTKPPPTLASYHPAKSAVAKKPLPAQLRVTSGSFLDYGIWASFAPTFDQDGERVGKRELGEAIFYKQQRARQWEASQRERREGSGSIVQADVEMIGTAPAEEIDIDPELEGLLPPEDVQALKSTIESLEFENSIQELLDRNQRALQRLEDLQIERLSAEGGTSSTVEEGSEEWDTAQAILDSLTLLASLRPRTADDSIPPLVPPTSVLRKLHRTLALEPSPGWYGTLPTTRATALRDDSTLKVRSSAVAAVAAAAAAPTPAAPAVSTPIQPTTYPNYAFAYSNAQQAQPYRPQSAAAAATTTYGQYKPGQPSYYTSYVGAQQQAGYYGQQPYSIGQQPYGAPSTVQQQPYAAYTNWYGQYTAPSVAAQNSTGSGRGTPQPGVVAPVAVAGSYGFFNAAAAVAGTATPPPVTAAVAGAAATAVRTPAVANTVGVKPGVAATAAAGWGTPALPMHLRYYGQYANQQPAAPVTR